MEEFVLLVETLGNDGNQLASMFPSSLGFEPRNNLQKPLAY